MIRLLARKVLYQGQEHSLSLVEISDDKKKVCISPYRGETYSTKYISGTLIIERANDGKLDYREL